MTKDQWIYKTALVIQTAIRNVDRCDTEFGVPIVKIEDRRALGECLDRLGEIEGELKL